MGMLLVMVVIGVVGLLFIIEMENIVKIIYNLCYIQLDKLLSFKFMFSSTWR